MHRSILVTGASSGIGEACAVILAQKGFRVYAAARRVEMLKPLAGLGGGRITPMALDVTNEASIKMAVDKVLSDGSLYGLVNNAGISVMGPTEDVSIEQWRAQYETNVFGLVAMVQAVLPGMRAQQVGRIINIGSIAGRIAAPFQGAYASSKHAVEGLSDSLRREVEPFGIKVSVVRPGFINTPFGEAEQESLRAYEIEDNAYARYVTAFRDWHAKGHPAAPGPNIVADAVHHALTADRPHSRYVVPAKNIPSVMIRNLAPSAIADRLLKKIMGLDKIE